MFVYFLFLKKLNTCTLHVCVLPACTDVHHVSAFCSLASPEDVDSYFFILFHVFPTAQLSCLLAFINALLTLVIGCSFLASE